VAPEVRRYLWDDAIITRDVAAEAVESHLLTAEQHSFGFWALHIPTPISEANPPIAGFCGFRFITDISEIELLYGLLREFWGRGLVTEACIAALEYLWRFTKFSRVYAQTDVANERSVRVMRRLGMAYESTTESLITYSLRRPSAS